MAKLPKPVVGVFSSTMAYARWGDGPATLLYLPGGPGNDPPTTGTAHTLGRPFRPLVESGHTLWMVTRRQGMPPGHSARDMADDYAQLISEEFGGRVDVIVGVSFGGLVAQYLAADHPERFGNMAWVATAHTVSEAGREVDYRFAELLSNGQKVEATRTMIGGLLSTSRLRWMAPVLGTAIGLLPRSEHDRFANDVMVEAEAEVAFDSREILPRIEVPVLLVGGDRDVYFPPDLLRETARLIPDCTLRIYPGKGHAGVATHRRLAPDIASFIGKRPAAA